LVTNEEERKSYFFILSIAVALVSFLTFFMYSSCDKAEKAIFFDRLLYIPGIFIPLLIYHFSLEFCKESNKTLRILLYLGYLLSIIFAFLTQTNYFVKDIFYYQWGCHTIAQIGHHFWIGLIFPYVILALFVFVKKWKNFKQFQYERSQIIYILVGIIFFLPYGLEILPAYKIGVYPFGYLGLPLFTLIIAYAITEKQLFGPALGNYILIAAILIFLATILLFPMVEIGIGGRLILFCIMAYLCFLLLKYTQQEQAIKEQLEKSYAELKKLDAAKTMFLSIASHQMRTPLTIIKGYLSLALSGDYGKVEGQVKDFLEQVYRANEREIALVNDLLDLTRIQTGKILYSFEDLSIEDLTAEVVKEIQPEAQTKNLQLVFDKPKEPLPKVKADSQKLRQVIFNLLDNAIKYTKQGEVRVSLEFNPHNQTILLKVKDTGMGMSPEEINNLFQLFNRSQAAVNTYPSGVGIGLYFASEIVKAHQGRIWAESAGINQGSTFYVELKTK
jgi:signal transduction histidine kinase